MPCHSCLVLTKDAIASCLAQDISVHLWILNNGSTDATRDYLASLQWRLRHNITVTHYYPARGLTWLWNHALSWVFNVERRPCALVVNNDIKLRPDAYRLLLADGGGFVTGVGVGDEKQIETVDVTSKRPHPDFSCWLIRREVWERVGPLDESMVLYASDADYHLRMYKKGIDAYSLVIPFWHAFSGTLKNVDDAERERICQQADRDRETFRAKWGVTIGSEAYYAMFQAKEMPYRETGRLA